MTPELANAVLDGIEAFDLTISLMVLSGSYIAQEGLKRGLPVIQEVFADRGYTEAGTLVARSEAGAFIKERRNHCYRNASGIDRVDAGKGRRSNLYTG